MLRSMGPRMGIIGAGRAGGSLAHALCAAGYSVAAVWSRSRARAEQLAHDCGAQAFATPVAAAQAADLVLLTITDGQIAPFSEQIATTPGNGRMIVHLSGAQGRAVLAPLHQAGWLTGAFHPLQTFADSHSPVLAGTAFAIEAEEPLATILQTLATALGGVPVRLAAQDRALYHAAATIASNYTVTLAAQAAELLAQVGLTDAQALAALLPLLRGTIDNLARLGLPDALTGPIARGDSATITRHIIALDTYDPALAELYRTLGAATLPLAVARGLEPAAAKAIQLALATTEQGSGVRIEGSGAETHSNVIWREQIGQ